MIFEIHNLLSFLSFNFTLLLRWHMPCMHFFSFSNNFSDSAEKSFCCQTKNTKMCTSMAIFNHLINIYITFNIIIMCNTSLVLIIIVINNFIINICSSSIYVLSLSSLSLLSNGHPGHGMVLEEEIIKRPISQSKPFKGNTGQRNTAIITKLTQTVTVSSKLLSSD